MFGAGVSRAVARAPVMKELFSKMKKRYEHEKKRSDCPHGNNRILWFHMIQTFIKKLEIEATKRFGQIKKRKSVQIIIPENIEYWITLLDMHTEHGAMVEFKEYGADWSPYPFIPLANTSREEMKEVRSHLTTYLYLCLSDLDDKNGILSKFFQGQLRPTDYLITFNYDLLIEKTLWQINQWSPVGGYVGVEQLENKQDEDNLIEAGLGYSLHKILKLHGSINWTYQYPGLQPEVNPVISLDNWEKWGFSFHGLEGILRRDRVEPSGIGEALISKGYAGAHSPAWILPSYVKTFDTAPFLLTIWRKAQRILAQAKYLVVLGYSFPQLDYQSQLLLALVPTDCEVLIVNPDADTIKERIDKLFRFSNISMQNMGFEQWVAQDCPGL